jgi:sulfonate transport system ATP-binding protein
MIKKGEKDMPGIHLEVERLNKKYGALEVLKGIDLQLKEGEFLAIVGRSGCGKSTFLRLLSGLEEPSAGKMLLDQKQVKGIHPNLRIMFQDARLLPWKTVLQNVKIGAKDQSEEHLRKSLSLVGLEEKQAQWPSTLSGGQRQRVALARALVGNPKILLLDEPLGALDALTRIEMQNLIERLWLQQRFTAILVTHDVSEAVALADRIIVLEDGEIAKDIRVDLPRPREKNSDFTYYERIILDQLLGKQPILYEEYSI